MYLDKSKLINQLNNMKAWLGIDLYYAVKTNSCNEVMDILLEHHDCFDVCTNGELDKIDKIYGSKKLIHTHPVKTKDMIEYSLSKGCDIFVVDCIGEVDKLKDYDCSVMIRVAIPNKDCVADLSSKFGCLVDDIDELINYCKDKVNIKGLCFHCGSGCESNKKHIEAIEICHSIMDRFDIRFLDIGGGFPAGCTEEFCKGISERFRDGYTYIAEPGRGIVAESMWLECTVIGKRISGGKYMYYINDGVYSALSGRMYDHQSHVFETDRVDNVCECIIFGQTCDSIDVVYKGNMPELFVGDTLIVRNLGAYSIGHASTFNGFCLPSIEVIV